MPADDTSLTDTPLVPDGEIPYTLKISRLTIDKLGVRLYDKISAVVAELIANGYDADAEHVRVKLPLNTLLAKALPKRVEAAAGGAVPTESAVDEDSPNYEIVVEDDGHGMTPQEARNCFLLTGRDRRVIKGNGGSLSREKGRPVMGRKGIGKLAPFGVCRRIEVLSAGGPKTDKGFLASHFVMDYENIVQDEDTPAILETGNLNNTYFESSGTKIRLSSFLPKRVPDADALHRQLAARFVFADPAFEIEIEDVRDPERNPLSVVKPISIPVNEDTNIDVSKEPLTTEDGEELEVSGWIAMAKNPYKYDELAGIRIYARNKIVAMTANFERKSGFTGEFFSRSYLVGEIHAEWLDQDDGEDLITSDRQRIIWDSDYGRALKAWGGDLIKKVAALSSKPRREITRTTFLEVSNFVKRANERFGNKEIVDVAVELAEKIGSFADADELQNDYYVNDLSEIILTVAPHKALADFFKALNDEIEKEAPSMDTMVDLFDKTRIAEMASYSRIAAERVEVINNLEKIVYTEKDESKFQDLISDATWLIEPKWSIITTNQALITFKNAFEEKWREEKGEEIELAIPDELRRKRPDFTLAHIGYTLYFVEIKPALHVFNNNDFGRLYNYIQFLQKLFEENETIRRDFPGGWKVEIIADDENLTGLERETFDKYKAKTDSEQLDRVSWLDFLNRTKKTHEMFLEIARKSSRRVAAS